MLSALAATLQVRGASAQPATDAPAPAAQRKLTKPPRLIHFVEAAYPESKKAAGRAATVVLELGITASGTVDRAVVVQSMGPAFDAAAEQAVRQFAFEPAEIDGKPAAIRILYRYEFVLRTEAPTTGILTGQVRDRRTKKPIASVHVSVTALPAPSTET